MGVLTETTMLPLRTIKVPFRLAFVTSGFRTALAACLWAACALAGPSAPYESFIRGTNVFTCGDLTVRRLTVGPLAANAYLVADPQKNAILIDPGAAPEGLLRYMADQGVLLKAYVLTHSHLDHISALDELATARPADVAMHPEENDWAFCEQNAWLPAYPQTRPVTVSRPLHHQQRCEDGGLRYTVLHTPGHSPGSVCLWFPAEKVIFTGDTLFAGTVGRTDLHRSSPQALLRSLGAFLALPPETIVFAGHGEPTTVAEELKSNPFLQPLPEKPRKNKEAAQ